jgi:hypothetical protein
MIFLLKKSFFPLTFFQKVDRKAFTYLKSYDAASKR